MVTRDELIRRSRVRRGTFASFLLVYGILIATMALTAIAII